MPKLKVIELFAGVGGFRIGLEKAGHKTVWANQWEPKIKEQHAYKCYISHFKNDNFSNLNTDIDDVDIKHDIPDEVGFLGATYINSESIKQRKEHNSYQ